MVGALASVVEDGEAVDVDTLALAALEELEQAALAHRGVELHDGDARHFAVDVVALLVVVVDELVGAEALGQQVVGDELVEQVVLRLVVGVPLSLWIDALAVEVVHHVLHCDVRGTLSDGG